MAEKKYKIKAIIFDIGGVLELGKYSWLRLTRHKSISLHQFMAKKLKISLDQWFDSIDTVYAQSIEGKITKQKALSVMARDLETNPLYLEKLFIKGYRKYFKLNRKLFSFAFALRKKGYKIAILSDQWHVSKEALLMTPKYTRKFDASIISCDVGVRKPNPQIYKMALNKLKIKSQEAIFVDNQKWNTEAAEKLGIKAILFKNNRKLIKELRNLNIGV